LPASERPTASVTLNYVIPDGTADIEGEDDIRNWSITYDAQNDTIQVKTDEWDSGQVEATEVDTRLMIAVTAYLALSYRRINDGADPLSIETDVSDQKDSLFS
jgi:hypothetical protein